MISYSGIVSIALFISLVFSSVTFGVYFEYSLIPAVFVVLALFLGYVRFGVKIKYPDLVIMMFIAYSIILSVTNVYLFKEALSLIYILFGYRLVSDCDSTKITRAVKIAIWLLLIIGLAELYAPFLGQIKSMLLTRSYASGSLYRGISSLTPEPSYFALTLFSAFILVATSKRHAETDWMIIFLVFSGLIFSLSTMIALMIPLILLMTKSIKGYQVLLAFLIIIFVSISYFDGSRFMQVILGLSDGIGYLKSDGSSSSRLFYIIKDLNIFASNYGLPLGPGGYELFAGDGGYLKGVGLETIYDPSLSGSFLGRMLVNYGFLLCVPIYMIFREFILEFGYVKGFLAFFFLVAVMFQMISLAFAPFSIAVGALLGNPSRISGRIR